MIWYVYILGCGNGSYYVGHTHDLGVHCTKHINKAGARHTAQNGVVDLRYHKTFACEIDADGKKRRARAKIDNFRSATVRPSFLSSPGNPARMELRSALLTSMI